MLNAFSRDIRSIRSQENIRVHSGAPLLSNILPKIARFEVSSIRIRAEMMSGAESSKLGIVWIKVPRVIAYHAGATTSASGIRIR